MGIIETRNKIRDDLINGFMALNRTPYIAITSFPETKEALELLEKKAKSYADNGAFYVAFSEETFGPKDGGLYHPVQVFTIYIFSNNKNSEDEIIEFYETAKFILYDKIPYLYYGSMAPVKSHSEGLWMAILRVGKENLFMGV